MRRRNRTGAKIIGRCCPAKWQLHVGVRIDAAGNDIFPARVNRYVSFHV
jgi:hypothetical protein